MLSNGYHMPGTWNRYPCCNKPGITIKPITTLYEKKPTSLSGTTNKIEHLVSKQKQTKTRAHCFIGNCTRHEPVEQHSETVLTQRETIRRLFSVTFGPCTGEPPHCPAPCTPPVQRTHSKARASQGKGKARARARQTKPS